ncbi:uncharacterized protein LOC115631940 [Scaptodrosophila lebanonensis]|uniref:Uncharacterized protein LOC115631940 n=1 Tax=Drosophila lebanonensis TaxID=7225 RepID=A0A6J2UBS9_DROLE|nr:uncharacterized protein LOC115631940 [Scaptodrosophila lebanonensis]
MASKESTFKIEAGAGTIIFDTDEVDQNPDSPNATLVQEVQKLEVEIEADAGSDNDEVGQNPDSPNATLVQEVEELEVEIETDASTVTDEMDQILDSPNATLVQAVEELEVEMKADTVILDRAEVDQYPDSLTASLVQEVKELEMATQSIREEIIDMESKRNACIQGIVGLEKLCNELDGNLDTDQLVQTILQLISGFSLEDTKPN